jgi:predicted neutral ceramidase superfamily lipid hydrolase
MEVHFSISIYVRMYKPMCEGVCVRMLYTYVHPSILSRVGGGGVRVTKLTGSISNDWIYWHYIDNLS